jgi:hypothetical protein
MGYDGVLVQDDVRKTDETSLLTDREKHLIGLAVNSDAGLPGLHAEPNREGTHGRHRG